MNELQQVLIVFAVIVILGLYFVQKRKAEIKSEAEGKAYRKKADEALNKLGEPELTLPEVPEVSPNQTKLPFDEFETGMGAVDRKPKHIVIEDESMVSLTPYSDEPVVKKSNSEPKLSFGKPPLSDKEPVSKQPRAELKLADNHPSQVFALMVMGTESQFSLQEIKQAMIGVGLVSNGAGLFVKKDAMGNDFIKVANIMEPGFFPEEDMDFSTQGVVMILELPTTVKAPRAMNDMILMARKMSQRLRGRIYNGERKLMSEPDLQAMRDIAVEYESQAI